MHDKPIYLLNILGYWDNLIHSFNQIIKDGFLEKEATNYFKICESVDAIFIDLNLKIVTGKRSIVGTANQMVELHNPRIPASLMARTGIQKIPQIAPA